MNNVDVNINQRWSLIAIFDIMWQINVTKCETTILYGVCTKSDYRCREEWGRVRSSPTPRGCAGSTRRPTGPRRAGPSSGTPSGASHRLWTIHYLPCTCVRFNAVVLRARFDETRSIKDMRILAQMLEDGEEWVSLLFNLSIFKNGIIKDREAVAPDWVFDQWHPWEKVKSTHIC